MSVQLQIPTGKNNYPLYEFPGEDIPSNRVLYNPDGVEINYGYDSQGRYRVAYGALDSSSAEFAFGGKKYTSGLHSINLSRPLANGEQITIMWYDGHELIIYAEDGTTKVKKRNGGSYSEIGKKVNDGENTALYFDDDMNTKRFDKIETNSFEEF